MKVSGETKLLLILGLIVLLGGGSLIVLNKPVEVPPPPPPPKQMSAAEFDAMFKGARHVKGDPNAKIKVVEFADFECPSCRRAYNDFLVKEKNLPVTFAFRHYPLDMHPDAFPAAIATEAAAKQGKFWQMYEALFLEIDASVKKADVLKAALKIGLDKDQFEKDIQDPQLEQLVQQDVKAAHQYNVLMTPTFIVRDASGKITIGTGTDGHDSGTPGLMQLLPLLKGKTAALPPVAASAQTAPTPH